MIYNETEIELMKKLDVLYMATIRTYLRFRSHFSKGQVSGAELAYIALVLAPEEFIQVDVDDIFRGE